MVGTGWQSRPVSSVFPGDAQFSEVPTRQAKLCTRYSVRGTGEWWFVSAESCRCAYGYLCLTGYLWKCTGPACSSMCELEIQVLAVCVEHWFFLCVFVHCLTPPSLLSSLIYNLYHMSFYYFHNSKFLHLCFFLIIAIATLGMVPDPGNAQSFPHWHQAVSPTVVLWQEVP